MMLPRFLRRLLVMSALAAANHRLEDQARTIGNAFPLLINDPEVRQQCDVVMQVLLDSANLTSASYNPLSEVARVLTGNQPGQ